MKHGFAFAVLTAASSTVLAQSSVQVYGLLDAGINHVTGLRAGTSNALVSGIMEGSRLGFKGNEDLGDGFRALFLMEHRLEVDTGGISNRPASGTQVPDRLSQAASLGLPAATQPLVTAVATGLGGALGVNLAGNFWDRQIYVGLVTPVGAVLAGRQYTPAYEVSGAFDTLGTQSSLSVGQIASFPPSFDIRVSNALAYRIEKSGFTASVMYALGEGSTTTGRLIGGMGMYKGDGFSAGIGYNSRRNELGQKSLSSLAIGGSISLGPGAVYGLYGSVNDDNPTGLSAFRAPLTAASSAGTASFVINAFTQALKQDARFFQLGYKLISGVQTIYFAYNNWNDRRPANADVASYGAAYSYALSKRTDINVVATHFNNRNLAQVAPGQAGFVGGVTASAGTDSNSLAIGVRHRF